MGSAQKHSIVCKTCAGPTNARLTFIAHAPPGYRRAEDEQTNACSLDVFGCVRRRWAILYVGGRVLVGAASPGDVRGSLGIEDALFSGYNKSEEEVQTRIIERTKKREICLRVECQKYVMSPPRMIANATKYSQ